MRRRRKLLLPFMPPKPNDAWDGGRLFIHRGNPGDVSQRLV